MQIAWAHAYCALALPNTCMCSFPHCGCGSPQVIRNAKLWCDVESAAEAAELSTEWGITLVPGFTASKIAWLKKNEPGNWARLRHVLLPHDYLNYFMTGRLVMEVRVRV